MDRSQRQEYFVNIPTFGFLLALNQPGLSGLGLVLLVRPKGQERIHALSRREAQPQTRSLILRVSWRKISEGIVPFTKISTIYDEDTVIKTGEILTKQNRKNL